MKKIFILLLIIITNSCKKEKIEKNSISGNFKGVNGEFSIILDSIDSDNRSFKIDSVSVINNSFKFKIPKSKNTKQYKIKVVSDSLKETISNISIWFENEDVLIEGTLNKLKTYFETIKVKGGKLNEIQAEFNNIMQKHGNEFEREIALPENKGKIDSLFRKVEKLIELDWINFIYQKPKNKISLENIIRLSGKISKDSLELYYNLLDNNLKSSKNGEILFEQKKMDKLKVGDYIQNFTAFDLNDKEIKISDFKGKIILLDFWASWCVPCHEQNQKEFSKLYKKYKDENLVIISYSLDKKDAKEKWKEASKKDNITWINISNLKGFNDPISIQYNITLIPNSFLIDQEGMIKESFNGYDPRNEVIEKEILKLMK
jgi:peroxiredoxin|tara:strand:+ start:57 stop:1178 length:1122 start_codon:yes stop_codon:yes gene_type:complete